MSPSPASATIIDGKALAEAMRRDVAARVRRLSEQGRPARLDAVIAADPSSAAHTYATSQGRACEQLGIDYHLHSLPADSGFRDVGGRVLLLSEDDAVRAIMVHLPLPDAVDPYSVQRLIAPDKDVEGVNPANIGDIVYGRSSLAPCTGLAVLHMVQSTGVALRGRAAVIVGASNIVGKPIAVMLMRHEATVVSCNKFTRDIVSLTRQADVLVAAAGVPGLVQPDWVRPGALVIDVGSTRVSDPDGAVRTRGDVDFEGVRRVAGFLSPVPGGVGPVTVATLLRNVVEACER